MRFFNDPDEVLKNTSLVDRFTSYIKIDTTASGQADPFPSSEGQRALARQLAEELKELGLDDVEIDENCYATAKLKGNRDAPTICFAAHLDTSPAASGADIKPLFHENYDGSPIKLPQGPVITKEDCPELEEAIGDTIITSDGSTLLGADNKAGIAILMAALEILKNNPDIPRPPIVICFTPDEEIGLGPEKFPMDRVNAKVAFTVDGCTVGDVNIETFHAESAFVTFTGVATHPGTAKGKLVNALRYLGTFLDRLPRDMAPETTEGREGFIHPYEISGDATSCKLHLILRDFDEAKVKEEGELLRKIAAEVAAEEPRLKVDIDIKFSYPNMHAILAEKPEIVEKLLDAVKKAGIEPKLNPVRGGTDGSRLTQMGLPTPNIFVGGTNFHGPTEWLSTKQAALSACTVLNLIQLYSE